MKLEYFKDKLFELLNDADTIKIKDIETNDKEGTFTVSIQDGSVFEVRCCQVKAPLRDTRICWRINQY
ncbi:MAG: hypothetical protein K2O40_14650 [Lachnospiraceae bacterium]|nr:hypothetical protein [Lachnospiraceae bacterium]MDE7185663.1 hypothetical protein [Lachnospiraceae bacterium]